MTVRTFRGLIKDGDQDTIVLHTNDGSMGYRIVKFEIMPVDANTTTENVIKIYKVPQTGTATTTIDFSDQTLLGAAVINDSTDPGQPPTAIITFDNEIFNQDIYVTNKGHDATPAINYYIELEQMLLDLNENTVATLKDIRNTA